ncbi:MAG: CapA family protein [Actinomycetota bacterium]
MSTVTLALAGDTMLGRGVANTLERVGPGALFSDEVVAAAHAADLFVLNLECCISERGDPWPAPGKPFFFRAPPVATEVLVALGVNCVSLANNHALDFGEVALLDTFEHLERAGIAWVGAGPDVERARDPAVFESNGFRLAVLAVTDHPDDFAATRDRPGVAFADLPHGTPTWLRDAVRSAADRSEAVLVTAHWGPNMTSRPVPHVRTAAKALREAGAALVSGHSAHVFHGIADDVLFDLGDFVDDYLVDPVLRNDLGLLFFVSIDERAPVRLEALPLKLDYCHTRVAHGEDAAWIRRRFREGCEALGTDVLEEEGRLVVDLRPG